MFQNEFGFDETVTTILDDGGQYEDVQMFIDDNEVFIRQWSEVNQEHELIVMSHKMFLELQQALRHPEGFFRTEI
jgi:hypothetical protein